MALPLDKDLVDNKLVEAPRNFIAGRPKAALLFFFLLTIVLFFHFLLARFIAAVSIVSISIVYDSSIVANCPSIPAARFAFCLCLFVFFLLCVVVLYSEPKHIQSRGIANSFNPPLPPTSNFIAGRPKAALLFGSLVI